MHAVEGSLVAFRVRREWAGAISREANRLASSNPTEKADSMPALLALALEITESTDKDWAAFLGYLESSGFPAMMADRGAGSVRIMLDCIQDMLTALRPGAGGRTVELSRITDAVERIDRESKVIIAAAAKRPLLDAERLRQGIEEAKRGEGEDLSVLLPRVLAGEGQ